jgi:cation transport ATPase
MTDIVPVTGVTADEALALAAAAEQASEHPLGEAIVRAAKGRGLALPPVAEFTSVAGQASRRWRRTGACSSAIGP